MTSASPRYERGHDTDEHEDHEDVHEGREPALPAEPGNRLVPVDGGDHRHHDRREEDEEAPEDERVHEAGHEPLQQLPLAEHDDRLVAEAARDVVRALDRLAGANEPHEEERAPGEEAARGREQRPEPERAREDRYAPRTFLSSAEMAGTISWRSPITA
jgi:hypothetical protein